jgi:hypothetical protein
LNDSQVLAVARAAESASVPLWSAVTNSLVTLFWIVLEPGCQPNTKGVPALAVVAVAARFGLAAVDTTYLPLATS